MICNLCYCPTERRRDGDYASHENANGEHCDATGMNPDEALATRLTFKDKGQHPVRLRLADDGNGITVRALASHHYSSSSIWVGITAGDARRMAVELNAMADVVEARGN